MALRPVCARKLGQLAVEGTQRQMTGLARHFQAIGKAQDRPVPEVLERRLDHVGVLDRQFLVLEEHLDSRGDFFRPRP